MYTLRGFGKFGPVLPVLNDRVAKLTLLISSTHSGDFLLGPTIDHRKIPGVFTTQAVTTSDTSHKLLGEATVNIYRNRGLCKLQ